MSDLPPARILDVSPDEYHKLPGYFSASLARILIADSALHAKDAADRQAERLAEEDESDGDDVPADKQDRLDRGSILHALVLGIGKRVDVIPPDILSKNGAIGTDAAKAFVKAARSAGRIPVKQAKLEIHQQVASAIKARISAADHVLDGRSELAIEWHEHTPHGPVKCKGMLDHAALRFVNESAFDLARPTMATIYDLKAVSSAHPERCSRTAENLGYGIAACAYVRALNALYPSLAGRVDFRFLFCETRRPYAIWDPGLSGPFREIGERRWVRARNDWAEGIATGRWPGYRTPANVEITAPSWTLKQEGYQPDDQ